MNEKLIAEFEFFIENQEAFVQRYRGKSIVIKDLDVVGVFDTEWEAVVDATNRFLSGTFIVQQVLPGPEAYTVHIASSYTLA